MNAPRPDPVKGLISLLQLLQEAREAVSRRELGFIMVNRTFELLRYDTALFWSRDRLGRVRIEAISGAPDFDRKARRVAKLERRIAEFAKKSGAGDFQKIIKDDTDAGERSPENILWCPLGHSRRRVDCGLWLTSASDWSDGDIDAMGHLCGAYSHAMNAVGDRPRSKLLGEWALKLSFVLALGLAAWAMTIPVEQTVLASATIVARDPVMITAP
ncbi:MAG: hypothetical protein HOK30_14435, partial [Rhodospirillaceae bacterium]|nr:hypothetical protein [Rhodospirillaceae bacterium]